MFYEQALYIIGRNGHRFLVGLSGAIRFSLEGTGYLVYAEDVPDRPIFEVNGAKIRYYSIVTPDGYSPLYFRSKLVCIMNVNKTFSGNDFSEEKDFIFSQLQLLADLLSFLMPFPAHAVNLSNLFRVNSSQYSYLEKNDRFRTQKLSTIVPKELGSEKLPGYEKIIRDYKLSESTILKLVSLVRQYPYLRSTFRLSRRAKETFFDGNISESIQLSVSALESVYSDPGCFLKYFKHARFRNGKLQMKSETFSRFIEMFYQNKKQYKFIKAIDPYKIRSEYLHKGVITDIDEKSYPHPQAQPEYLALQSLHFTLQKFVLRYLEQQKPD